MLPNIIPNIMPKIIPEGRVFRRQSYGFLELKSSARDFSDGLHTQLRLRVQGFGRDIASLTGIFKLSSICVIMKD